MMRKLSISFLILFLAGCSTTVIPEYLQERGPYSRRVYGDHPKILSAVKQSLEDMGWAIEKEADPADYEQAFEKNPQGEQILIITGTRATPMFLGTRFARMNIYIRCGNDVADIQVRYMTITSAFFQNFKSYRNDAAVERFLTRIEEQLKQGGT